MSEFAPVHIVFVPHHPSFAPQIAQEISGYRHIGFEREGGTVEERSEVESYYNALTDPAFYDSPTDSEKRDLRDWAQDDYIASTLMELRGIRAQVTLIDVPSDAPESTAAQDYSRAKDDHYAILRGGRPQLIEAQTELFQTAHHTVGIRDAYNARLIHEHSRRINREFAAVVGLAHVGLPPLLEQKGHPVTTSEVGTSEYVPYDVQLHRKMQSEGVIDPVLMQRSLLVGLCHHYETSYPVPQPMDDSSMLRALDNAHRSVERLNDAQVGSTIVAIEDILQDPDMLPLASKRIVAGLLRRIQDSL